MRLLHVRAMVTAVSLLAMWVAARGEGGGRAVTVEVTVQTATAEPLADVPLRLAGSSSQAVAKTDETGSAVLPISVGDGESRVTLMVFGGADNAFTTEEQWALRERMLQLLREYVIVRGVDIDLEEGVTSYAATITAWPAVRCHGQLVGPGMPGEPVGVALYNEGPFVAVSEEDGSFTVPAVRPNHPATLFVEVGAMTTAVVALSADQIGDDGDVGEVTLPAFPVADATVDIRTVGFDGWKAKVPHLVSEGISLISQDGLIIHSDFVWGSDSMGGKLRNGVIELASGVYYAAPGNYVGSRFQTALFNAITSGQDLSQTSVVRLDVQPGQSTVEVIDLEQAYDAIVLEIGLD